MNQNFIAFLNEAQFTKEILGIGVTQIRKANYTTKGIYYQSFTCLATGLERIGKLCLILDYYIDNKGSFPDISYVKKNFGHDIESIFKVSTSIVKKRAIKFYFTRDLGDEIYQNILNVLSEFAKGDRYSNINLLVNIQVQSDSIQQWHDSVDKIIFEKRVSEKKKQKIIQNAAIVDILASNIYFGRHISEEGEIISDLEEASLRTGIHEAIAPYRQLYVLQIIRFWVELIMELQYEAMKLHRNDIPFFSEVFALFFNPDKYLKTRKTWDAI